MDDVYSPEMRRVSVIGSSGSGKTTFARSLASHLGVPWLELDSVFWQEGWAKKPPEDFRAEVAEFVTGERWVVDGNYTSKGVAPIVWERADTVIWLDPSRPVVMGRVIGRTLRRAVTRQEIWNGNREPLTNLYSRDPYKNIIVWAWTRFEGVREKYEQMMRDGTWDHATVVRLRTGREVREFLAGVTAA